MNDHLQLTMYLRILRFINCPYFAIMCSHFIIFKLFSYILCRIGLVI